MDGITSSMIKYSLDPQMNSESAKKAQESTGKSGSFFFFSFDKRFIIKTMFTSELDKFMENITDYFLYIDKHPDTLIARIYGIFQI
jgi:1-phosphatidylinositol-4-phosphate 5-kinase